jgi:uncharacterized protein (TIGR02117 family)
MTAPATPSRYQRWRRIAVRGFAALIAVYCVFLLSGFIPVNGGFVSPSADDGVRIFIRTNEIHTDLVLPANESATQIDWQTAFPPDHFRGDVAQARFISIGWGNRAFYVDTPRWSDARLSTAVGAVFPSDTVLHVEYLADVGPNEYFRELRVSHEQYRQLANFIRESIAERDEQGHAALATRSSYNHADRFYLATGSYHAFNNCNQWTGRGLQRAGVKTGIWTPLKQQVYCWLK